MISSIFHCADVHLYPYKRHAEYRAVFDKLFEYIRKNKDDDSVICLGGDIVNNKIDITVELVDILSDFLRSCADLCPTILVLGNHDYSTNMSRMDVFTPIVKLLNHPNLHYWRETGIYELNGVHFSVHSLLGSRDNWISANQFEAEHKIAIFHGPVISDVTKDTHFVQGSRAVDVSQFEGFDITLLGDLHFGHFSNKKKTVGYPGSLIQINHGETPTEHGILVWDVPKRKAKFVEIKNDYCYYTMIIKNDYYEIPTGLPKNVRLKVKYENSTKEIVNEAIQEFSKKYKVIETSKHPIKTIHNKQSNGTGIGNSRDVSYQNELIVEQLKTLNISDEIIQKVKKLNVETNQAINNTNFVPRGIIWTPKKLSFSNMFSYGEDNEIDFTDFEGIYGISGKNYGGKSSLLDILCFCLYDKSTRATKAVNILNINKDWFKCKFSFEFNGKDYFIERSGQKNEKTGNVRVEVKFWSVDDRDNEEILTGEDRDSTNKIIREYVGTYDDFVMTVLSTQYDNQSFVDKSQKERKELLYRYLDISMYDDLYRAAKEINKEQQTLIKYYESENLYDQQDDLTIKIDNWKSEANNIVKPKLLIYQQKLKEIEDKLFNLNGEIQQIDEIDDIGVINKEIETIDIELSQLKNTIEVYLGDKIFFNNEINEKINLDGIDIERFVQDNSLEITQRELNNQLTQIDLKIIKIEADIKAHQNNIIHLESHEYDPECEYCCNNEFVKNAKNSIEILPQLKSDLLYQLAEKSVIESKLFSNDLELKRRNQILYEIEQFNKFTSLLKDIENKLILNYEKQRNLENQLNWLNSAKQKYYKNEQILVNNARLVQEIEITKKERIETQTLIEKFQYKDKQLSDHIWANLSVLEQVNNRITKYEELLKTSHIYDLYTRCLSRDGIPYLILERVMPLIEYEVNEVLNKIVDFTVRLESTPERYIHAYIDYGNDQSWPVEMTSGMERFILTLAFRNALTEITSLARPNFLAIDEGFGVLDSDNLISMGRMFDFLRTRYNYLLIVSHIDTMKDLVDRKINIQKIDGYSIITQDD